MSCTIAIPKFKKDLLRAYMLTKYTASVRRAGAKAVWIETDDLEQAIEAMLQCDGLLLSGGEDIDPFHYGQTPTEKCGEINKARDHAELKMLEAFLATGKPILGICRGIQLINVALGGTLVQDLEWEYPESGAHRNAVHTVKTQRGSFLHRALGKEFQTNSFHHQALKTCGEGLAVTARTADGVIEGVEHCSRPVLGVQWHPERDLAAMLPLFRWFVEP